MEELYEEPGYKAVWVAVNEVKIEVFKHPSRRILEQMLAPFVKVGRKYTYVLDYEWSES